jgi:hypothetical protein
MKNTAVRYQSRQKIMAWRENDFKARFDLLKKSRSCAPFVLNLSRKQRAAAVAVALNFI